MFLWAGGCAEQKDDVAADIPPRRRPLSWASCKNVKNTADIINVMDFPSFGDLVME